jgi:outer membrane receptor protein involved in Fe transport
MMVRPGSGEHDAQSERQRMGRYALQLGLLAGVMALSGAGAAAAELDTEGAPPAKPHTVETIIVTAEKREERLQDVPAPVTALNSESLVATGQLRLQDYYLAVPGLNYTNDNRGASSISIRGLSTSLFQNPTVATLIDDVPYTVTTAAANGWGAVEIDPNEVAQIEVLRGPQGVLYGAASLGGIIKYQTIQPSTVRFSGRIDASLESVNDGSVGYGASGAINVPLSDDLAVRASGFDRRDPGYIDNVLTGQDDVNHGRVTSARVAALWDPSHSLSVELGALVQQSKASGASLVENNSVFTGQPLDDLQQSDVRGSGVYDRKIQSYAAKLVSALGGVQVTSVTGYSVIANRGNFDFSYVLVPFGLPPSLWLEDNQTKKFSEELRITGAISKLDWMAGAFFTRESSDLDEGIGFVDASSGAMTGRWFEEFATANYTEYAGFANVDYHLTGSLDVQVGARLSENKQSFVQDTKFSFPTSFSSPVPERKSKDTSFTYLLTPRWKVTPDIMVYARLASGYRPGGPNALVRDPGLPREFGPDKTDNYEAGVKGDFLGHRLSIDASIYDIEWKDVQINVVSVPNEPYAINGGKARSRGAELAVSAIPYSGMKLAATAAWNDAKLMTTLPSSFAVLANKGDRLPYSAPFSGEASITQDIPLSDDKTAFAGLSVAYVGKRLGEFGTPAGPRLTLPAYTKIDLRGGVRFATWELDLFVNNVGDSRGVLQAGTGSNTPGIFTFIQPRTAGMRVEKRF